VVPEFADDIDLCTIRDGSCGFSTATMTTNHRSRRWKLSTPVWNSSVFRRS